jgi:hypothetical protein
VRSLVGVEQPTDRTTGRPGQRRLGGHRHRTGSEASLEPQVERSTAKRRCDSLGGNEKDAPASKRKLKRLTVIAESPAPQAREQRIFSVFTDALAGVLAEETGVVEGARHPELADEVRACAERAMALVEEGLGDYAIKGSARRDSSRCTPGSRAPTRSRRRICRP